MTKAVLITSDELRHRYAAEVLASCLDLCGIVSESKADQPKRGREGAEIVRRHFSGRDVAEKRLLGWPRQFPENVNLLVLDHGKSNNPEVFEWIKGRDPSVVILYGSSIIKPPLLSYYDGRMINLHLGLSPYFRGSGTNFWPLVDGLPECVGATIHLATLKVDGGDILAQVRPANISADDRAHELGTKTIISGLETLCDVVPAYLESTIKPMQQDRSIGKLCRRKDFTPEAVTTMNNNFDSGMIPEYLARKDDRDSNYPIIDWSR